MNADIDRYNFTHTGPDDLSIALDLQKTCKKEELLKLYPLAIRHILSGIAKEDRESVAFGIRHIERRLAQIDDSKSFENIIDKAAEYISSAPKQ